MKPDELAEHTRAAARQSEMAGEVGEVTDMAVQIQVAIG